MTEPTKPRRPTARLREPMHGWPEQLIIPGPEDFTNRLYLHNPTDVRKIEDVSDLEIVQHDCGTTCCMLGWIQLAFAVPAPDLLHRVMVGVETVPGSPADEFQREIVRCAGADPVLVNAEEIFMGWEPVSRDRMPGKQAHELWCRAASKWYEIPESEGA